MSKASANPDEIISIMAHRGVIAIEDIYTAEKDQGIQYFIKATGSRGQTAFAGGPTHPMSLAVSSG